MRRGIQKMLYLLQIATYIFSVCALRGGYSILIMPCASLVVAAPNYRDLAPAALLYAWIMKENVSCDSLAEMLIDLESDAFPTSGTTIRLRIVELLRKFTTSVEQDQQLLLALNMCQELAVFGRTSTGQVGGCATMPKRHDVDAGLCHCVQTWMRACSLSRSVPQWMRHCVDVSLCRCVTAWPSPLSEGRVRSCEASTRHSFGLGPSTVPLKDFHALAGKLPCAWGPS